MKSVEGNIQGFILSIVGVAVVLAVGLIVLAQLSANANSISAGSTAVNATNAIITQLGTVPNWIGIIITVALAFIVLGYFYNRM